MNTRVPSRAPILEPVMGASTQATPLAARRSANFKVAEGEIVLESAMIAPLASDGFCAFFAEDDFFDGVGVGNAEPDDFCALRSRSRRGSHSRSFHQFSRRAVPYRNFMSRFHEIRGHRLPHDP